MGELLGIGLGSDFIGMTPKAQMTKAKIDLKFPHLFRQAVSSSSTFNTALKLF